MALTERKRKYAEARERGANQTDAAKQAGYSAATAPQAASRIEKDPDVIRHRAVLRGVVEAKDQAEADGKKFNAKYIEEQFDDPRDFLAAVMNSPAEDPRLRVDAAKTLMAYTHAKPGEAGKKQQRQEAAGKVGSSGRFSAAPAPAKLRAVQ